MRDFFEVSSGGRLYDALYSDFFVASGGMFKNASATATVMTVSSVKSQPVENRGKSLVFSPMSNSKGLPMMSPKMAPYINYLPLFL